MSWRRVPVHTKLTVVTTLACVAVLLMAGGGIVAYELIVARGDLQQQMTSVADLVAAGSTATVQFGDERAAQETLDALQVYQDVEAARIDPSGDPPLADYRKTASVIPAQLPADAVYFSGGTIVVSRPIVLNGREIGAVRVQGSGARVYARVRRYVVIVASVIGLSALLAYALSSMLQRLISGPIGRLADTAERVSSRRDYTLRATKESDDELGLLVDRFNEMLTQIERRDMALMDAHVQLEGRVRERTETLEQEIVEHRRTENELILAKAAAESANAAKSAFLANMSHELRTPLNAIIGYSELLTEEADLNGWNEGTSDLAKITGAGRHLLALIDDVLDLSKIEAGRMELTIEPLDLTILARTVVTTSATLAMARGNELTIEGGDQPLPMWSDPTRIQQVLLNLVGNACKFTTNGRILVGLAAVEHAGAAWVRVTVADSGIGMSADQLGRLFHEFSQADRSTTRRFGGTGLGLAISRRLCVLLGGTIDVASQVGTGSTFTVHLPAVHGSVVAASAAVAERPGPTPQTAVAMTAKRIER